ncbi:E3 ubiquitin-protein ligase [Martiniozyma asiatica (nom. inval.)]|nr:E3 ubiquitin-protein ligase [Martiniozyma asiatica]
MSDYESDEYYQSDEFDEFESDYSEELVDDDSHLINYTHPKTTSNGVLLDRMKYTVTSYEDIEIFLKGKAQSLSLLLQIDWEKCINLLLQYDWNDHKLMENFMGSSSKEFMKNKGISLEKTIGKLTLIKFDQRHNFLCEICYCGPEEREPMEVFSLNCGHKYCFDCYSTYLRQKISDAAPLIKCPFESPKCNLYFTLSDLKELSDVIFKRERKTNKPKSHRITTDDFMDHYQRKEDKDSSDEEDVQKNAEAKQEENMIFDYNKAMEQKEKQERIDKRNETLFSKYSFNMARKYVQTNTKDLKSCLAPDCDSIIKILGFDSDDVFNIKEMQKKFLIPTVQCASKHRFCAGCNGEMDHAPCPCSLVESWRKKCKDDSETANWITTNTKDCPNCRNAIEKNGGCNHMSCTQCQYHFCWICMGKWSTHKDSYNCNRYVESTSKEKIESSRKLLEKYVFYFSRFDNQRVSYEKDKILLEKFETKISELQKTLGVSYIETLFYRECIDVLLSGRNSLMWSYSLLFYMKPSVGKTLIEASQCNLMHQIEGLSHFFENTTIMNVMKVKSKFLDLKTKVGLFQEKFLETCEEVILGNSSTFIVTL